MELPRTKKNTLFMNESIHNKQNHTTVEKPFFITTATTRSDTMIMLCGQPKYQPHRSIEYLPFEF